MILRHLLPWFLMAPADAGAGAADDAPDDAAADETDAPDEGADDAPDAEAKAAAEKKAADEKAAAEKKAAEKKGPEKKVEKGAKKTLLGDKDAPAEKPAKGEKPKAGADKGAAESELDTWTPKLADGVKVDEELLGEARKIAKAHGLKGEQLQGFVDLGVKMQAKAAQSFVELHEANVEKLTAAAKADKEIGGGKLEESLQSGLAALKRFAGADFPTVISELERTGLGSHPALIKTLVRIDKATREDDTTTRVRGGVTGAKGADPMTKFTQGMYPKMRKELARERGEDVDDDE